MATMNAYLSTLRASFPPAPKFTEKNLGTQTGKVFIVTGATGGVGKELAQILYSRDAKVYIAGRSSEKGQAAISSIQAKHPESKGTLVFLHLDLNDLTTIRKSAEEFLKQESKLDVLWNNAGVMVPPQGSKTAQGYDLQLGTNCVAPFLFTKLLTPILQATAKTAEKDSVRVVWVSSSVAEVGSPKNGVDVASFEAGTEKLTNQMYGVSKAGNWYHAAEYAKLHSSDGIISVALNPGNLKSELVRHLPQMFRKGLNLILYEPKYGAYTELYAGLSPDVTMAKTGCWIQPWGRFVPIRSDLAAGAKSESEGGTGIGRNFWEWCEAQVKSY